MNQTRLLAVLVFALLLAFAAGPVGPASAATFIVNSTANTGDTTPEGVCDSDAGAPVVCTLREAIQEANFVAGPDVINFNIPALADPGCSASICTISPTSTTLLPQITVAGGAVTIDGTTQPGFAGTPRIELSGANAGVSARGLQITAGGSVVKGLAVNRFALDGILIFTNGNTSIQGNYIGTDVTGGAALGNGDGLTISDGSGGNCIGGAFVAAVCTPAVGGKNIISGNTAHGIEISSNAGTANVVIGNYVGTTASGAAALGNGTAGIFISGASNTIGGTADGARNVVSGNGSTGIQINGTGANTNIIAGNYIGTDVTGTVDLGNTGIGILIIAGGSNTIGGANGSPGGSCTGACNLISGNEAHGIDIRTVGNVVKGNYIGTDATGNLDLGNGDDGINTGVASSGTVIGSAAFAERNVISGNGQQGIELVGPATVQGNFIGATKNGAVLGNASDGVRIQSSGSAIGGTGSNLISFNGGDGVFVISGTGNSIRDNIIDANTGLGIDLGTSGVTANDAGDGDTGANNLQNFPVMTSATKVGGGTLVEGTINSTADTQFNIDFYTSSACDASGNGEGASLIGTHAVSTFGNDFTFAFTAGPATAFVTATATRNSAPLDTSEFSNCVPIQGMSVDTTSDASLTSCTVLFPADCSLRGAITNANSGGGADVISFATPAGTDGGCVGATGVCTIAPGSALPAITEAVTIDGYTQPGAAANTNAITQASNAVLKIELDGTSAGAGSNGLLITGGSSRIRGLAINRFTGSGIRIEIGDGNAVGGNFIGTDITGMLDLGNTLDGVGITNASGNNCIGGTFTGSVCGPTPSSRNVISGNNRDGVALASAPTPNFVKGNFIGLAANGDTDRGNSGEGIHTTSPGNVIGGTEANNTGRNIISGNESFGIVIQTGSAGTTVYNNYVGTDKTGTLDRGNASTGIATGGTSTASIIGGSSAGQGNLVSGNNLYGISTSATNEQTLIEGNKVGTNAAGTVQLPNTSHGVVIDSSNNEVGGTTGTTAGGACAGSCNLIAFNGGDGIFVQAGTGNAFRRNSLHSNAGLGIDLSPDGVTANDLDDVDTGVNNIQNFPVLTSVVRNATTTTIQGTLNSTPNTSFLVELSWTNTCDASAHGEGEIMFADSNPTTDAGGDVAFIIVAPVVAPVDRFVVATARDPGNNTSEFSACIPSVNDTDDDGDGFTDLLEAGVPVCIGTAVGTAGARNDDSFEDALVNDGCPAVGAAEVGAQCTNGTDDDADGAINDGCPAVVTPESVGQCANATDDDGDGLINEGCAAVAAPESGQQCLNATDNDGDGAINDGCPPGFSEAQFKIGTSQQDPCGNNGWPLELVSTGGSANRYDVGDLGSFVAPVRRLGKNPNQAGFDTRWDFEPGHSNLAGGGWINIVDLSRTTASVTAFPPMLGGVKAQGQLCPFPP